MQRPECRLDRALRESGFLRDLIVAEADPLVPRAGGAAPQEQVDDKRGGAVVVPDEVAKEHVDDVAVEVKDGHRYISNDYSW